jgi:hypothetical protein
LIKPESVAEELLHVIQLKEKPEVVFSTSPI